MLVKPLVRFYSLLIGTLLLVECLATAGRHSSIFKSIRSTDDECDRYSNERNGNCSVRCRGLLLRFWDDQRGKLGFYALKQFYQPDPEDKCYLNRTMRCLKRVSVPDESCQKVAQYVRCYKDQYGEENTAIARFIPFTPMQQTRILMECAAILGISEDSLREAAKSGGEIPQEACLLRCFLIRQGLYSEAGGFELERLELQCGGYGSGWNPVAVQQCIANVTDCDSCTKVQRMAKNCLQVHFKVLPNPNTSDDKLIPVLVEFYGNVINDITLLLGEFLDRQEEVILDVPYISEGLIEYTLKLVVPGLYSASLVG
ncbi:general odorant-binding protein 45 [Aedes albopictus]|uniref:Uncharacterized protein n=1 Tax=Aedes albopictus TaxID=7160 RepID=A0ABM1YGQ1_AEDAL|nr:general odorant-binding protein 45 [Aedes albopictus]